MRVRSDLACALAAMMLSGCGGAVAGAVDVTDTPLRGAIVLDGAPDASAVAESAAEQFLQYEPDVSIRFDRTGERSALRRLCDGEVDVVYATRQLTPGERSRCARKVAAVGIATEALAVIAHPDASWARCLSPQQVGRLASASGSTAWADVVAGAPAQRPRLVGRAYAHLYSAVAGRVDPERASLSLLDPAQVIAEVQADRGALGFIGAGWLEQAGAGVRVVAVREPAGCVLPVGDAVRARRYRALARPISLVFAADAPEDPTRAFLRFTVEEHATITGGAQLAEIGEDHLRRSEQLVG